MEFQIDLLIDLSYKKGRYQKLLLFFCFITWLNSNLFNTSMGLFTQPSLIQDPTNQTNFLQLNRSICRENSSIPHKNYYGSTLLNYIND